MSVPRPAIRVLAGAGAAGTALWFGVNVPLGLAQAGCPGAAATLALATLPLVLFLAGLALAPAALQRALQGWTRIDVADAGHVGAAVVLAGTLFFVLGFGGAVTAAATIENKLGGCDLGGMTTPTADDLVRAVLLNLIVFTLPVLLYVGIVHGGGPAAAFRALGMHLDAWPRALAMGVGLALAFLVLLAVAAAAVSPYLPESALQNDQALAIARSVTPVAAVILALGSGIGEEIFFRGYLQARIGLLASSTIFALAHVNYGSISEVVVVFALSLALGAVYRASGNLLAPIAGHATFNFVQLVAGMMLPEG